MQEQIQLYPEYIQFKRIPAWRVLVFRLRHPVFLLGLGVVIRLEVSIVYYC